MTQSSMGLICIASLKSVSTLWLSSDLILNGRRIRNRSNLVLDMDMVNGVGFVFFLFFRLCWNQIARFIHRTKQCFAITEKSVGSYRNDFKRIRRKTSLWSKILFQSTRSVKRHRNDVVDDMMMFLLFKRYFVSSSSYKCDRVKPYNIHSICPLAFSAAATFYARHIFYWK